MTNADIISELDKKIALLRSAREILAHTAPPQSPKPPIKRPYTKRKKAPTA